ncbi:helix-turn-helix domain-containing protein [Desulfococcaceae bacterium HSG8]|nr:helix-turn-helix domain-containing protein [Desulfococcaceae bacterium HSG8]
MIKNKGWLRIKSAAVYCDVSEKNLRGWFERGLPFTKVKGTVLIKKKYLDEFLEQNTANAEKCELEKILGD